MLAEEGLRSSSLSSWTPLQVFPFLLEAHWRPITSIIIRQPPTQLITFRYKHHSSYHFGVVGSTFLAFYAVVVKGLVHAFMQAFVANDVDLFVDKLWWKLFFSLFYLLSKEVLILLSHDDVCHSAWRTVEILKQWSAFDVNQMAASHVDIPSRWVEQSLKTDWAVRQSIIGNALMVCIWVRNAVSASKAMSSGFLCSNSAHFAIILTKPKGTQWKILPTLAGLFSNSLHLRQKYCPKTTPHFLHFSAGSCSSWQFKQRRCITFSNYIRSAWHPFLYSNLASWHSLQG